MDSISEMVSVRVIAEVYTTVGFNYFFSLFQVTSQTNYIVYLNMLICGSALGIYLVFNIVFNSVALMFFPFKQNTCFSV